MNAFVQLETLTCIDIALPDGRSELGRKTLEQIRAAYPGAEVMDLGEFVAIKEQRLCSDPQPITEERFIEMLEVLPPQRWLRGRIAGVFCESFELCEHLSGRVTSVYVHIGGNYFEYTTVAGQTLDAHVMRCQKAQVAA